MLKITLLVGCVAYASAYCANSCSGHGTCGENDICSCYDSWTAPDCSERECPYGLSWVAGTSSELAEASVPGYDSDGTWGGYHAYTECSSKGICDHATGECKCFDGYGGKGCRRADCPNDCSGHGLCAKDADVAYWAYGGDNLLASQKQYWNNQKTQQCLCDAGFWGYDCSLRVCPQGDDPESSCGAVSSYADIQFVTTGLNDTVSSFGLGTFEQFFTLSFTDMFNGQYTTRPISFFDDAATVQQALMGLPNYAIPDVEVFKVWPGVADDTCSSFYYNTFVSVECSADSDCDVFQTGDVGNFFCHTDGLLGEGGAAGFCVESEDACVVDDGSTEFSGDADNPGCANGFEPDGIYKSGSTAMWGRRVTAYDRGCKAGKFDGSSSKYAVACSDDSDCHSCGGWTSIVSGVCTSGVCAANDANFDLSAADDCWYNSLLIKFSDNANAGEQNLLTCNSNSGDTAASGAAPHYVSDGIATCDVMRVGVPEWSVGVESTLQSLCIAADDSEYSVSVSLSDSCTDTALTMDEVNDLSELQNLNLQSLEGAEAQDEVHGLVAATKDIFTDSEIADYASADYDEIVPCANEGACDPSTGTCACQDGFTGEACEIQVTYV